MYYDYEYFCGANCVVEIDGVQVTEISGITFSAQETKRPIYGYSSRHFDAIARGQVLVRGSLIIPFVHRDYLFRVLQMGRIGQAGVQGIPAPELRDGSEVLAEALTAIELDPINAEANMEALREKYWDVAARVRGKSASSRLYGTYNAYDMEQTCNIKITFGERSAENAFGGKQNLLISDVAIISRGIPIQISSDCIMEEYGFFARNLWSLKDHMVDTATVDTSLPENEAPISYEGR